MLIKIPYKNLTIIEEDTPLDIVLKNDKKRIYSKYVTQFVIDKANDGRKLVGIVTSSDLKNMGNNAISVQNVINCNPVYLTDSCFTEEIIEGWLQHTQNIDMVPVVDENKNLLYAYLKPSKAFVKYAEHDKNPFDKDTLAQTVACYSEKYDRLWLATDCNNLKSENMLEASDDMSLVGKNDAVIMAFRYDYNADAYIKMAVKNKVNWVICFHKFMSYYNLFPISDYYKMDKYAHEVFVEESYINGNYFDFDDFQNIMQLLNNTKGLEGDYVEIGVYRGDSARAALSYMKKSGIERRCFLLDTYEGFTYDEAASSLDVAWNNTHSDTSMELVNERVQDFSNVVLKKNNIISDDFPSEIGKIALCNIDVDMYEAVKSALDKVKNRIVYGGVIIAEDYGHTPELTGARYAVEEFYAMHEADFYKYYLSSGQCLLVRKPSITERT